MMVTVIIALLYTFFSLNVISWLQDVEISYCYDFKISECDFKL